MKKGLLVLAALAALWVGFRLTRNAGFSDGWEAGRCYDWKEMNQMARYYGFDRSKIADTGARVIRALMRHRRQVEQ
jgi:hypothetical protein